MYVWTINSPSLLYSYINKYAHIEMLQVFSLGNFQICHLSKFNAKNYVHYFLKALGPSPKTCLLHVSWKKLKTHSSDLLEILIVREQRPFLTMQTISNQPKHAKNLISLFLGQVKARLFKRRTTKRGWKKTHQAFWGIML